eukprot:497966-Pyramimonas_sp.AAC.1
MPFQNICGRFALAPLGTFTPKIALRSRSAALAHARYPGASKARARSPPPSCTSLTRKPKRDPPRPRLRLRANRRHHRK